VNVCTEQIKRVDVKVQISAIGRQKVITRDNVDIEIDSVIYYAIGKVAQLSYALHVLIGSPSQPLPCDVRHRRPPASP
jgi:erythrocyte band 7 integral membrane protein